MGHMYSFLCTALQASMKRSYVVLDDKVTHGTRQRVFTYTIVLLILIIVSLFEESLKGDRKHEP